MKKLLNTLYITRQKSYLHKERETIVVKLDKEKLGQFPALTVSNILCFGQVSVSPFLMGYCGEKEYRAFVLHGIWKVFSTRSRQTNG